MRKVFRDIFCFFCLLKYVLCLNFKNVFFWWKYKDKCVILKEIGLFLVFINVYIWFRFLIILNFSFNVNFMMILVWEKNIYWFEWDLCGGL